jgi:hypothetical protein
LSFAFGEGFQLQGAAFSSDCVFSFSFQGRRVDLRVLGERLVEEVEAVVVGGT